MDPHLPSRPSRRDESIGRLSLALAAAEYDEPAAWQILDAEATDLLLAEGKRLATLVPVALARLLAQLAAHPDTPVRAATVVLLSELVAIIPREVAPALLVFTHDRAGGIARRAEKVLVALGKPAPATAAG